MWSCNIRKYFEIILLINKWAKDKKIIFMLSRFLTIHHHYPSKIISKCSFMQIITFYLIIYSYTHYSLSFFISYRLRGYKGHRSTYSGDGKREAESTYHFLNVLRSVGCEWDCVSVWSLPFIRLVRNVIQSSDPKSSILHSKSNTF